MRFPEEPKLTRAGTLTEWPGVSCTDNMEIVEISGSSCRVLTAERGGLTGQVPM